MFSLKNFSLFGLILLLSGCGFFWHGRTAVPSKPAVVDTGVSVQVIDESALHERGRVVFIPFSAGEKAEAGPVLDRLSLKIMKGVADAFFSSGQEMTVVEPGVADADLVLEGHIEEFRATRSWKRVWLGRKDVVLRIQAELRDKETSALIALVYGYRSFKGLDRADQVAYGLGQRIAQDILEKKMRGGL